MGAKTSIGFINSFFKNIKDTQKDKAALVEAKTKRSQATEIFKLKKQKFEGDIKEQEIKRTITTENAKRARETFKAFEKGVKAKDDLVGLLQDSKTDELMAKDKQNLSIARQLQSMTLTEGPGGTTLTRQIKPVTGEDRFKEGLRRAESGDISFDELEGQFPLKRTAIKKQRISGLPEKSQRLLDQVRSGIKADAAEATKSNTKSNPELVVAQYLIDLVENKDSAEKAGHDVDEILDILGVTEQEILDAFPEDEEDPKQSFISKIKEFGILGAIRGK